MGERERFGLDPENKLGLTDDDVVSTGGGQNMMKLASLLQSLLNWSQGLSAPWPNPQAGWFRENGIRCEILRTNGGGWQAGKLRFRLEFIPDNPEAFTNEPTVTHQPESPLDDLRAKLNNE